MQLKAILYTSLALIAFAANSIFCRMALGGQSIDAAGFTLIRLFSAALTLGLILLFTHKADNNRSRGSWSAAVMLFVYALCFSFAYISLDTGTGALILFGSVQMTMIGIGWFSGTRLHSIEWFGLGLAFSGFVYLVLPGISTPSASGFLLMSLSGIAWGAYTLRGRASRSPLADTGYNFIRTLPLLMVLLFFSLPNLTFSTGGIILAILSGALASGIGYSIWYRALPLLTSTQAAIWQLSVPVIAAFGGVLFIHEDISIRLLIASILILGGISIVVTGHKFIVRTTA